jgi:hypothetical protein
MKWIKTKVARKNRHRKHPKLASGRAWVFDESSKRYIEVDKAGWVNTMCRNLYGRLRKKQRYFKNRGKWYPVTIKRSALVADLTTTFPPWSDVQDREGMGNPRKVEVFRKYAIRRLVRRFVRETNLDVPGATNHGDTPIDHFDIWSARVGWDGALIDGTEKHYGLVGPKTLAILRRVRLGLQSPDDAEAKSAEFRRQREFERHGREALDVQLAFLLDDLCEAWFGSSPFKAAAFAFYKANYPWEDLNRIIRQRNGWVALYDEVSA